MDDDGDIDIEALIADWEALQIRATGIVRRLQAAEARRSSRPDAVPSTTVARGAAANGLRRGDRVRIKNRVIKPATWPSDRVWLKEEARRATGRNESDQSTSTLYNGQRHEDVASTQQPRAYTNICHAVHHSLRTMSASVSTTAASTVSATTEATGAGTARSGGRARAGGRRNRSGRGSSRNSNAGTTTSRAPRTSTYKGSTAEMNGHVFECFDEQGDRRQYAKTVEALQAYMQNTMRYSEDLKPLFAPAMLLPMVELPVDPGEKPTKLQEGIWNGELSE
jgi:hypothetical protein